MALAILTFNTIERGHAYFTIDIGTNKFFQLKIGSATTKRYDIDWIDSVSYSTPITARKAENDLLNTQQEVAIPARHFDREHCYVQLFSYKSRDGKSPAFSRVRKIPVGLSSGDRGPIPHPVSQRKKLSAMMSQTPNTVVRRIPEVRPLARQASFEDLLSGVIKIATPIVMNLMSQGKDGKSNQPGEPNTANTNQTNIIASILESILKNIPGVAQPGTSKPQSFAVSMNDQTENRFCSDPSYSRPFVFGIDDAIIGALAGQVVKVLPQLLNAANQNKLQMKQANNKLVTDLVSDLNRRLLVERLAQLQRESQATPTGASQTDINQLIQLLQQPAPTQEQTTQPADTTQANQQETVKTSSLSLRRRYSGTLSNKVILTFLTEKPIHLNGTERIAFAKQNGLTLNVQLNVAEPVPKNPLAKAITKICFKNPADQTLRVEKQFKQKNILPNSTMTFSFSPDEIASLPVNTTLAVYAELRWLTSSNRECKAVGSTEITLVNGFFIKERGNAIRDEQELTDMNKYRAFWNKIWEAPVLDDVKQNGAAKKFMWDLDATARYTVTLSRTQDSNGLMATKFLRGEADEGSIGERVRGRMKAGIELSVTELNKLRSLWNEPALGADQLEAFRDESFTRSGSGEFVRNLKLKGRAGQRGMVWVTPTFKLYDFTLGRVARTADTGQVIDTTDERVQFPIPVAARVIGVKSE